MSFARYDHIGEGGLLKKANLILKQSLQENGWSFYFIGRLTNKDGPIRGLTQACVYAITKDKKTYIVPLCAKDYTVFQKGLVPFLERIHGATSHKGKIPRKSPQTSTQTAELLRLRRELNSAVAKEDYEEAGRIRDRIRSIREGNKANGY